MKLQKICRENRFSDRDSNRVLPEYKSKTSTFETTEMDITACTMSIIGHQKEFLNKEINSNFIKLKKERQNRTEQTFEDTHEFSALVIPETQE